MVHGKILKTTNQEQFFEVYSNFAGHANMW